MSFIFKLFVAAAAMLTMSGLVTAEVNTGKVVVTWLEPDKYTDIDPGDESAHRFNQRMFAQFEGLFARLSEQLPAGYQWKIEVMDIDLAGRVNFLGRTLKQMRIIDNWFNPKLVFSYSIMDVNGKVVMSAEKVELRERFKERFPSPQFMNREFSYEMYMVRRWFSKEVLPKLS